MSETRALTADEERQLAPLREVSGTYEAARASQCYAADSCVMDRACPYFADHRDGDDDAMQAKKDALRDALNDVSGIVQPDWWEKLIAALEARGWSFGERDSHRC